MKNYFELLIIVAIGAMLFIMTGMVTKENARRTQCQANLKELYRAVQQYESAHGTLPPLYIAQRPQWLFWHHFVSPMVKDVRSFACPSDPRMSYLFEKGSPLFGGIVALTACYGMNRFMLPAGAKRAGAPEFKLKYLKDPSHTVFLMDSVRPFVTRIFSGKTSAISATAEKQITSLPTVQSNTCTRTFSANLKAINF